MEHGSRLIIEEKWPYNAFLQALPHEIARSATGSVLWLVRECQVLIVARDFWKPGHDLTWMTWICNGECGWGRGPSCRI
jgi:hypothetical protein